MKKLIALAILTAFAGIANQAQADDNCNQKALDATKDAIYCAAAVASLPESGPVGAAVAAVACTELAESVRTAVDACKEQ